MKKILFTLLMMFVLTACGGGSGPSTKINVILTEFSFSPAEFKVPAGQEITITGRNEGAVTHEFAIMKFGKTVGEDFGDEDQENIYWEFQLGAGSSVTETFTAPAEPGEYQVVCGTPGHYIAGMAAKLIVVADK